MSVAVSHKDDCPEIRIITTITNDLAMEHEEIYASSSKIRGKFLSSYLHWCHILTITYERLCM